MPTGTMGTPRKLHTATLLPSGKVLIAGGDQGCGNESAAVASAELYDPTTRSFIATGSMGSARSDHGAASLPGDKVLLVGGVGDGGLGLKSAGFYQPVLCFETCPARANLGIPTQPPAAPRDGEGLKHDSTRQCGGRLTPRPPR